MESPDIRADINAVSGCFPRRAEPLAKDIHQTFDKAAEQVQPAARGTISIKTAGPVYG